MAKDPWLEEIDQIINDSDVEIKRIIREREEREKKRAERINTVKDALLPRLETVRKLINQDKVLPKDLPPKIIEDDLKITLEMPRLSEVNSLDLVYKIEMRGEITYLRVYNLYPDGKLDQTGFTEDDYDDFVKDSLKSFLQSWYTRKIGTELDKEREYEIMISHRAI